ncbi:MAG: 6-phosphogluconate dehydrogenase (decarboxylating) [Actinomycetia bacterium]|jgi:6-phosphogluconate dehydrogenase|nr:6-phosphogluconate dehydrogenase (decarboxylating) [Actinomycetes bacterium]
MQIAMVGLGRMGANLVRRLMAAGHECVVYDVDPKSVAGMANEGATPAKSMEQLKDLLTPPRVAWVMVPAAYAGAVVRDLADVFEAGDIVIDGGNSYYRDDIVRAKELSEKGLHYLDVGTSGGVYGLERGFCLMIGGEPEPVHYLEPIFRALAPGLDAAPRTAGRKGEAAQEEYGYLHCGAAGAGHFVKMVHNGIEYGLMASYAEGFAILNAARAGLEARPSDAETAPLEHPEDYQYEIDTTAVSELWRRGSVVSSWLLDLTAEAFLESPGLKDYSGRVADSGEGRWTAVAAIETGVPAYVLTAALQERFSSQGAGMFVGKVLSAMRKQFGGHTEFPSDVPEQASQAEVKSDAK